MNCTDLVKWLNDLFGNDRTKPAIENRMSLIRGNYTNLPEAEHEGHKNTISRIEACGIEIPPTTLTQFTNKDYDETIDALVEGIQLLEKQVELKDIQIENLKAILGKVGIKME